MIKPFTFQDISENLPPELVAESDLNKSIEFPTQWNRDGIVVLPKLIPNYILNRYENCWNKHNSKRRGGWPFCTPYMYHPPVRKLCLYKPLTDVLESLIGEPAGLHLNLTGFVSTERKWHQDTYLNPPDVGTFYVAAWIALEDIHPDSGPFEFVMGSHTWPVIRRDKLFQYLAPEISGDPGWPSITQDAVAEALEKEIVLRDGKVITHLPKRGDVLLWHSNLVHRGSKPNVPGMPRKACIAHYSGINHRPDFPKAVKSVNGSYYYPIYERNRV